MRGKCPVTGLQIGNGLVGPVGVFDLVQLGLGEGVVEVLDGHLIEGDHVLELGQLRPHTKGTGSERQKINGDNINKDFLKSP